MKIVSSKRDDILKEKAEYEEQMSKYNEADKERNRRRISDEQAAAAPVENYLKSELSKFNLLSFQIGVDRGYDWEDEDPMSLDSLEVRIRCNDDNKFDENVALTWSYDVSISGGKVKSETSSWSGMNAVTPEQLDSLKQTVSAIEFLQSVDWEGMIKDKLPSSIEYYKDMPSRPKNRDFDRELLEEDIRDSFGKGIGFKGREMVEYESRWNRPSTGYYFFYGETKTQYRCVFVDTYYINNSDDLSSWLEPRRMKKSNVISAIIGNAKDPDFNITVDSLKKE